MNRYKEPLSITHPKLVKEWHPTKNGNLTPDRVTAGSGKKVWWLLSYDDPNTNKHFDFEWEATIYHRVNGVGCPYFSGHAVQKGFNDLATTCPDLAVQWHPTKNGDLTPADVTTGNGRKVWWYLPYNDPTTGKHFDFEWEATVLSRVSGTGCPYLSGHASRKNFNDFATTHPELAKEWHPIKNGSLMPNDVSAGSHKKVWWYLPYDDPATGKHFDFEWEASVTNRTKGNGCPYFTNNAVWKGFNDFATAHPDLAAQWHPTKNGDLTPEDVTACSNKKVWWILPYDDPITGKHFDFEWEARIIDRVKYKGCPYLSSYAVWVGFNDLATTHPELAKEWHPTKNGSLTSENITAGSPKKVWWRLPYDDPATGKHFDFEWEATVSSRAKGVGCPYLSGHAVCKGFNDLATIYPDLAAEWHPTKNGVLTPNDITTGNNKKVWWQCLTCGHEWLAAISSRSRGSGCPLCSSSQGEKTIYSLLKSFSINFIKGYAFANCKHKKTLRFDFVIFDKNDSLVFLIEYDGEQHTTEKPNYYHKRISYEECKKRDDIKNQYCKDNSIPLLRISYENADRVEEIVLAELKKRNLI